MTFACQAQGEVLSAAAVSNGGRLNSHGFTSEQVQRLLSLIEALKPIHDKLSVKKEWLFDSGASYYMIENLIC